MSVELNEHQAGYVASLVRMDLRKKLRSLEKAQPFPGQHPDDFAEYTDSLRDLIEFRRAVLAAVTNGRIVPSTNA